MTTFDLLYVYSTRWSRFHLTLSIFKWPLIGVFYYIPDFPHFNCCAHYRTYCILDVLFYIAYSARYSLFVLMCRKPISLTHSLPIINNGLLYDRRVSLLYLWVK